MSGKIQALELGQYPLAYIRTQIQLWFEEEIKGDIDSLQWCIDLGRGIPGIELPELKKSKLELRKHIIP